MTYNLCNLPWLPKPGGDFNSRCKELRAEDPALGSTIRSLSSLALNENQLTRLGTAIDRLRRAGSTLSPLKPWRLGLLSNTTTDFAVAAVTGTAPRHRLAIECVAGGYDQAMQDSLNPESELHRFNPDAVLIAIDWRGLSLSITAGENESRAAESALAHIRAIREAVREHSDALCIVQNLAPPPESLFGSFDRVLPGTLRRAIDAVNEGLADDARETGNPLLDVAGLASSVGLENWYSPQAWYRARLPFAQECLPLYADHVCRIVAALAGLSRRCLILDLDNTMWGGVIGDDGVSGIRIAPGDPAGEPFLDLQRYALDLRNRGIVLAVASKNDEQNARRPFREREEMVLREGHFASFRANWQDKPSNIEAIAEELSLGLDSFVFVDDNPFEREFVRERLPQVAVPEMPDDPALYTRILSAAGYFEAVAFSEEDRNRPSYYADNSRRAELKSSAGSLEAWLASLDMRIYFRPFDEAGRVRIAQLINKSNQFNLTTRRYSEAEVAVIEQAPDCLTMQVRLTDRLGDNGMISIVICRGVGNSVWEIDTWLMSCRVLGRKVENSVLRQLLELAAERGAKKLVGRYIPTERNGLVRNHYADLGFTRVCETESGESVWEMELPGWPWQALPLAVHLEGYDLPVAKR